MNLCILVPSEEYKSSAGARIRYERIFAPLARRHINASIEDIGDFDPGRSGCDIALISKCYDVRAIVAAAALAERGILVGVDLFDDYFSDPTDSRLLRFRHWLGDLVDLCDFALCSTSVMADVARDYRSDLPIHVLNDPAPAVDLASLSELIARKISVALERRRLEVLWFGVGDSPYFSVGLADLAASAAMLGELWQTGLDVGLTVLTNRRALTAEGLGLIARLPVATEVREWSEGAEADALEKAALAWLPVNARPFSRAKSLNRAVTALTAGCQVVSLGYPLYAALEPLIYRECRTFLEDFEKGSLRLSSSSIDILSNRIDTLASPDNEAERFAGFVGSLSPRQRKSRRLMIVHGRSTVGPVKQLAAGADCLSIASPYCAATLDFDVVFRGGETGLQMLISGEAAERLRPEMRARLKGRVNIHGRHYSVLGDDGSNGGATGVDWCDQPVAFQLATYAETMRRIDRRLTVAFGPSRMIVSELSRLPFGDWQVA